MEKRQVQKSDRIDSRAIRVDPVRLLYLPMEKYRWSLEAENRTSFVQQCAVTFADMKVRLKGTCMDRQLQYHATGFCMKIFIVHAFSSILLWESGGPIFQV